MSTTAPFGFRPVRHTDGSPWNGQTIPVIAGSATGTAMFIGDLLAVEGLSATAGTVNGIDVTGMQYAIRATGTAVGQDAFGVVVGFAPNPDNLNRRWKGADEVSRIAYVAPVTPNTVFEAVVDESGTVLNADGVGMNRALVTTAGSTAVTSNGLSGMGVLGGPGAVTSTLPVKVIGVARRVGNTYNTGTAAATAGGVVVDVIFNTSQWATNAVGVD